LYDSPQTANLSDNVSGRRPPKEKEAMIAIALNRITHLSCGNRFQKSVRLLLATMEALGLTLFPMTSLSDKRVLPGFLECYSSYEVCDCG